VPIVTTCWAISSTSTAQWPRSQTDIGGFVRSRLGEMQTGTPHGLHDSAVWPALGQLPGTMVRSRCMRTYTRSQSANHDALAARARPSRNLATQSAFWCPSPPETVPRGGA
jgi:hypothetical protein